MVLVNSPVTVVRDSGTVISATLTLGYDVPHERVDELLKQAADITGLEDPFVLIIDLGDFSVNYRVGGFTDEIGKLLSKKSKLRKNILSIMRDHNIEIVSPNFMNQRILQAGDRIIPDQVHGVPAASETTPEEIIFDKADLAARREQLKEEMSTTKKRISELDDEIKASKGSDTLVLKKERELLGSRVEEIKSLMEQPVPDD